MSNDPSVLSCRNLCFSVSLMRSFFTQDAWLPEGTPGILFIVLTLLSYASHVVRRCLKHCDEHFFASRPVPCQRLCYLCRICTAHSSLHTNSACGALSYNHIDTSTVSSFRLGVDGSSKISSCSIHICDFCRQFAVVDKFRRIPRHCAVDGLSGWPR